MITLEKISKNIAGKTLFENVNISFNENCRYGLTGPNGCGKTTLLKIIMGKEEATSGKIFLPKKVGFLKQNIEDFQNNTILDIVIMGNIRLWQAMEERNHLYEVAMTDQIGMRLAELEEIIAEEEGYSAEAEAEQLLLGMSIEEKFHAMQLKNLPIDKQFRVLLCQALFGSPRALLLDEPTNHLDLDSIGWLEHFLKAYKGILVVVSHDRYFLNNVCTKIADIDYETIIIYPGNYDDMILAKTAVRQSIEDQNKAKDKKIAQLNEFISRFSAGTRASQVQSRKKEMEKLQPSDLKQSNIQKPYIRFTPPQTPSGRLVFRVESISKRFDMESIISNLSFDIMRGEKVAIIGNNGLGKSTLLKMLASRLNTDSGVIDKGHNVQIGYFPQNHSEIINKEEKITLFDWLKRLKEKVEDLEIRSVLGKMLFSGDDAFKETSALSGGETARLLIAGLMLTCPNVIILDEPNNHLDLESVSALTWGLEEYKGTAIFASHDRDLISKAATKLIVFEKGNVFIFDGPLDEYLKRKNR